MMKRYVLLSVLSISFFCITIANGGDSKKIKPSSKKTVLKEAVTAGFSFGAFSATALYYLSKKGYWLIKETKNLALAELIIVPVIALSTAVADYKYGFYSRKTSSAYLKFASKIILGRVTNNMLLDKIIELAEGTAISIINQLIESYGFDDSEKELDILKGDVLKAREYLFDVLDEESEKELKPEELKLCVRNRKKVDKVLKKIEATQKLVSFKKEYVRVQQLLTRGQQLLNSNKGEIAVDSEQSAEAIGEKMKKLLQKKKTLPYSCVSDKEFLDLVKKSKRVVKDIRIRQKQYRTKR